MTFKEKCSSIFQGRKYQNYNIHTRSVSVSQPTQNYSSYQLSAHYFRVAFQIQWHFRWVIVIIKSKQPGPAQKKPSKPTSLRLMVKESNYLDRWSSFDAIVAIVWNFTLPGGTERQKKDTRKNSSAADTKKVNYLWSNPKGFSKHCKEHERSWTRRSRQISCWYLRFLSFLDVKNIDAVPLPRRWTD